MSPKPTETMSSTPAAESKKKVVSSGVKGNTVAAQAAAFILKVTKQKPLKPSFSQMPHVSSGMIVVDNLIGGQQTLDGKSRICPGFPRKFITELYGAESSGKTTLAIRAAVEVQKAGGVVMFLDYEHALHHGYAKSIGLSFDPAQLLFYSPGTLEDGLKMIYVGIKTGVDLIIADSVAAMVPAAELEKNISDAAKIGALAKAFSEQLPKVTGWLASPPGDKEGTAVIFINQTRAIINTGGGGHGDPDNTSGGKALKFYAYCRIKLTRLRTDSFEKTDPLTGKTRKFSYGNLVQVKIVKNKVSGTQGHTGDMFIRFGYGPDEYHTAIEAGVAHKIIKKEGAYFGYGGERFQGKEKFRTYLTQNPKVFAEVQDKLVKSLLDSAPQAISDEDLEDEDGSDIMSGLKSEGLMGEDDTDEEAAEETIETPATEV